MIQVQYFEKNPFSPCISPLEYSFICKKFDFNKGISSDSTLKNRTKK